MRADGCNGEVHTIVSRLKGKMKPWGVTISFLAAELGVSRQYAWQILNNGTPLSVERAREIEGIVDGIIEAGRHLGSLGARLRAARIAAGLTLKEAAELIGYSWVGVQRWEKDICLPKPGVLWHLMEVYGPAARGILDDAIHARSRPSLRGVHAIRQLRQPPPPTGEMPFRSAG
jgi:transcriptional regulator with XRE-family HTH domain